MVISTFIFRNYLYWGCETRWKWKEHGSKIFYLYKKMPTQTYKSLADGVVDFDDFLWVANDEYVFIKIGVNFAFGVPLNYQNYLVLFSWDYKIFLTNSVTIEGEVSFREGSAPCTLTWGPYLIIINIIERVSYYEDSIVF